MRKRIVSGVVIALLALMPCVVSCAHTTQLRYAEAGVMGSYEFFTAVQRIAVNAYIDGNMTEEEWASFLEFDAKVKKAHDAYRNAVALAQTIERQEDLTGYLNQLLAIQVELTDAITSAISFLTEVGVLEEGFEI